MKRWLWMAAFVVGCDDAGKDTGTEDTEAFSLSEGDWAASPLEVSIDECNIVEESEDEFALAIEMIGETTFSITGTDLALSCTLAAQDFDCAPEQEVQDFTGNGTDVVMTIDYLYGGSFDSDTDGSLTYTVSVSCVGEDCSLLEEKYKVDMPCTSAATTHLTFAGG